jgi:hypothetical protein
MALESLPVGAEQKPYDVADILIVPSLSRPGCVERVSS